MTTTTFGTTTYTVETLLRESDTPEDAKIPYRLVGPRGASYLLMRNVHHPDQLFAVNERGGRFSTPFTWVHEEAPGTLVILR